jgi:hypothetical protein
MTSKPTRFYSKRQETQVANIVGGKRTPNSGATMFAKGDVVGDDLLVECKTVTKPQKSITLQKEWITKNEEEAFARGKDLPVVAFDFGDGDQYFIVNAKDFKDMLAARRAVRAGNHLSAEDWDSHTYNGGKW